MLVTIGGVIITASTLFFFETILQLQLGSRHGKLFLGPIWSARAFFHGSQMNPAQLGPKPPHVRHFAHAI